MGRMIVMKKLFLISLVLFALVVTVISVSALGEIEDAGDIGSINDPVIVKDSLPATLSVAAMYAPNENYGVDYWRDLVCSGMTIGGCEYFKSNLASEMWGSQIGHAADFVNSVTKVETINAASEVWKAHLTIFTSSKEKVEQDIFVLVERGADNRWYLNRVLHGPGIQQ
jgi:hypothetical protein